ncbi:MAG TPA: ACT domain-containing protein [Phycisphaerae bacterium]|jgi:hypothetical protein|nr:ACT domain-containing protein [Phycisphaerae bacterium]HOB76339.1 ACT domain-containing protein [Phycisphaerae bacterium]HOJ55504.1 ACT domain-containing protein [Phycisphaerae bacterium]HOL26014.1 ACT domain-containing protein [Phycisphaerae bacterium]HPP22534.1 ACT domain-containing protein [Phycisphaerae bacterium]
MKVVPQFSVFLINKPGVLAQVSRQIATTRVNILAMTMTDSSEHGVLRLVAEDPERLRTALATLNLPTTETDVLVIDMPNRPGALADVCGRLAEGHINISYAYCTTGASGGKTKGVFKVADTKKAMKLLGSKNDRRRKTNAKIHRPMAIR